jgi:two-component system CheB/CheR fusion protein
MNAEERQHEIARSLFREANDAIFLLDPTYQMVVDLNPAALRLTGLEKRDACRMTLGDLFYSTGPDGLDRLALALTQTGFFHSREGYFLHRAGREALPVNISVSRIHTDPEPIGLVVARDISERKRAQDALKQVQARYNSLVESTGVVVWEIDVDGTLVSLNPAFEVITGWPSGDWIGERFDGLLHPDEKALAKSLLGRAIRGESLPRFELRIRTRGGDYLDSEFLLVTKVRAGATDRILGITRDCTEQKRAEQAMKQAEELRRARDTAEQASRAKSEFLSNVSHELRTPLSAILGFAQLLNEHPHLWQGPEELSTYVQAISEHGEVLLALIDDLLDLSQIEAGQLRVEIEPCSPRQLVSDAAESLRSRADAKQLTLATRFVEPLPLTIATDRLRLQQVLVNLLDNAIKFTDAGSVHVTVRLLDPGDTSCSLQVEVSDSGIGMTEDEMSELFQPFYQARSTSAGRAQGHGLGLAICKRLCRELGGDVTVRSTRFVGSTFALTIPVGPDIRRESPNSRSAAQTSPSSHTSSTPPRLNARVLLAEDHEANRQILRLRLSQAGAEVVQACNGREAIDIVREATAQGRPIDAVVMDMEMPVLDGYEAVRQLRLDGFKGPILAVTAYAMTADREECLTLGCDDFISKPVDWDLFFDKLSALLEAAGGPVASNDQQTTSAI